MTKFLMGALLATSLLAGQAFAAPDVKTPDLDYKTIDNGTYVLDGSHASVVWRVWHMGYSHFAGRFDKITGTASVNTTDMDKSGVSVNIDAKSGDTGVAKLDAELIEPMFFDAAKYPAITFKSTKLTVTGKTADGKATGTLAGDLTLHGVTKPVVLDVVFNGHGPNPMGGAKRMGFNATGTLKRSDFGVSYGIPVVSDEVTFEIAAEFTKAD